MDDHDGVVAAIDAFDAALRAGDRAGAENVWAVDHEDVAIIGSGDGEFFLGPSAVRSCLAGATSRPTAHGWRRVNRRITIVGDVAWVIADAPWQTIQVDGSFGERPYRFTGVLVRERGGWRWCQYHGSEPLGSIG